MESFRVDHGDAKSVKASAKVNVVHAIHRVWCQHYTTLFLRGLYYKTFCGHNLRIFVISQSVSLGNRLIFGEKDL